MNPFMVRLLRELLQHGHLGAKLRRQHLVVEIYYQRVSNRQYRWRFNAGAGLHEPAAMEDVNEALAKMSIQPEEEDTEIGPPGSYAECAQDALTALERLGFELIGSEFIEGAFTQVRGPGKKAEALHLYLVRYIEQEEGST